jgi:hypothetical protein
MQGSGGGHAQGATVAAAARRRRLLGALLALTLSGAACVPSAPLVVSPPVFGAGTARFEIALGPGYVAGSLSLWLDGRPERSFQVAGGVAQLETEVASGPHVLAAIAHFDRGDAIVLRSAAVDFEAPAGASPLVTSQPAAGAAEVARSEWAFLEFAEPLPAGVAESFELRCDGVPHDVDASALSPSRVAANPVGELPAGAACELAWRGRTGRRTLAFSTAAAGPPAVALYDRGDPSRLAPYPDDFYRLDPATCAEGDFQVPLPDRESDVVNLVGALLSEVNQLDGFSPIGHFVLEFSDSVDPASLPATPAESLEPSASVGLFDLDPTSPTYARRVPFRMEARDDVTALGLESRTALVFPSIPLEPGRSYGFVVTRRALVDPGRPLDPSPAFAAALAPPAVGEDAAVTCTRSVLAPLLATVEQDAVPPIPRDDIAIALRVTIRTTDDLPRDMLRVRDLVAASPLPAFSIDDVVAESDPASPVAAVVTGSWEKPDFRDGTGCARNQVGANFARDAAGDVVVSRTCSVPFTLALPRSAESAPAPIVFYQHGNPGNAEDEVPSQARRFLGDAGFAVIGFTDILNRELSPGATSPEAAILAQVLALLTDLLDNSKVPDYWAETNAEQIAFLRLIQALSSLDVLPVGAPDGQPDLDLAAPLAYMGISQGANHAPAFLPYAPELRSAALVAGGSRLVEVLLHQQAATFLENFPLLFPHFAPVDLWVGLALFQAAYDRQDAHNHGRFLYRQPLVVDGTTRKPSVLLVEGLDDSLVPNHASESLAWQLGPIPLLEPVQRDVPFLAKVSGPVVANVDAETTAAFYQYVPLDVPGIDPTPGCIPPAVSETTAHEGHYCAQSAAESRHQRVVFFQSALVDPAPTIIDPLESP